MAKLYDIADRYTNIMALIDNEDVDFSLFKDALDSISDEFETKCDNIAFILKDLEANAKAIKEEEQRLAKRRKSIENSAIALKQHVENMMRLADKKSFKTTLNSFSIQKSKPVVVIINEDLIADEYKEYETVCKINKNELYNTLKLGIEIEGVELKDNESLRIR